MRPRLVLTCSLALSLAAAGAPAFAAAKAKPPVCGLITDAKGDGHPQPAPALKSSALDITGADVATGKRTVVAVLRVVATDTANDPLARFGMEWSVSFSVKGTTYTFQRRRTAGVAEGYRYTFNGLALEAKDVRETKTDIRWTVARSAVPELKKPRLTLENLAATSRWFTFNADAATSAKRYADLTPSCLKAA